MRILSVETEAITRREMQQSFTRFVLWQLEPVLTDAARLVEGRDLRSLDALQLACALDVRKYLPLGDTLLFIASDNRLLEAARSEGLAVWNPELTSAPDITFL